MVKKTQTHQLGDQNEIMFRHNLCIFSYSVKFHYKFWTNLV